MNFVNGAIESLRSRFSNLWSKEEESNEPLCVPEEQALEQLQQEKPQTNSVEGFVISTNQQQNRSLVLVQSNEHTWQTKWFNNTENTFTTPNSSLQSIFK